MWFGGARFWPIGTPNGNQRGSVHSRFPDVGRCDHDPLCSFRPKLKTDVLSRVRPASGVRDGQPMNRDRIHFLFLNIGHFLDHMFTLIFATVAALALTQEWGLSYGGLLKYATPGFFAFGVFSLPAGWLADKWSREG